METYMTANGPMVKNMDTANFMPMDTCMRAIG